VRYVNPSSDAIVRLTDRHDPNRRGRCVDGESVSAGA
jgi:hypothetical protein